VPREHINLEPLGVLAVQGFLDATRATRARADQLRKQADTVEDVIHQRQAELLGALAAEYGITFPAGAEFKLAGAALELIWEGEPVSLWPGVAQEQSPIPDPPPPPADVDDSPAEEEPAAVDVDEPAAATA
jgi:hypothetical protein